METKTFEAFRSIIYQESGIVLQDEKKALLSNRIQKRMRHFGLEKESEYLNIIELDVAGEELQFLIDAISTNVTSFYREASHFVRLRQILDEWKGSKKEISIWCAAASSGEEPYTIAFESLHSLSSQQTLRILASDICTDVLETALQGLYTAPQCATIPAQIRESFMDHLTADGKSFYAVRPQVKELILFKKLNLVRFPYPLKGPLDIIFCRNVMIYFDKVTRAKIVAEFERLLRPGGYLFISHSENLIGLEHNLTNLGSSLLQKKT